MLYHNLYYNTGRNNFGLYFGSSHSLLNYSSFIFKFFKDNGYIIGTYSEE